MRADSLGFFWEDRPVVKTRASGPREWGPMPEIPETGWKVPTEFPNLSAAKVIALDCETYDPELLDAGPGWGRGKGHIVGVSLAVQDGTSWYFPIRHEKPGGELYEDNLDAEQTLRWLRHTLSDNRPKVGANLIYDIGWLTWEGVPIGGRCYDVQFAEAILDSETPRVDLDDLAERYLGIGKTSSQLYEWLAQWNSKAINDKQRRWIYKTPPSLAGPYAEDDAALPLRVIGKQWEALHRDGLLELFDIECRLIPLLVAMRVKGAPVNLDRAEEVYEDFGHKIKGASDRLAKIAGQPVNPSAPESIKSAFTALGLEHPTTLDKKTGETKASFAAPLLEEIEHPIAGAILEQRRLEKVRNTFVKGYIIDKSVNGRLHCSFHPLKGSGGGARSGRFASSDPNLQNIPVRTEDGKKVRQMFESSNRWRSIDYQSIEYRLLVHFAVGPGADDVRRQFAEKPDTDYHEFVSQMLYQMERIKLDRRPVKNINFGIIYGMALNALAAALGLPKSKASKLLESYHDAIPYARPTMDACANEVHRQGYVETLLGRRSQFPLWGPKRGGGRNRYYGQGLSYEAACKTWGPYNIERQHTHKALNRKLQGSAADVMKKGMVEAYEAGLFAEDACGVPCLTVHDELDFDDQGDLDNPAWRELERIMCSAIPGLRVPLLVDAGVGKTWGDAH